MAAGLIDHGLRVHLGAALTVVRGIRLHPAADHRRRASAFLPRPCATRKQKPREAVAKRPLNQATSLLPDQSSAARGAIMGPRGIDILVGWRPSHRRWRGAGNFRAHFR